MQSQDGNFEIETLLPVGATSAITLLERIEQDGLLVRSMTRLLGEAMHLGADAVSFNLEESGLLVSMTKGGVELRALSMKPLWFNAIQQWILARSLCTLDSGREMPRVPVDPGETTCTVRIEDDIVAFNAKKISRTGKKGLRLSNLTRLSLTRAFHSLGLDEKGRALLEHMVVFQSGLIIVAAPDDENLQKSVAALLAVSHLVYAGDLHSEAVKKDLPSACMHHLLIGSLKSDDSVDALLKLRDLGYDADSCHVRGAICQGFVKAVCRDCARETVPEKSALQVLPDQIRPLEGAPYFVGRGCDACGHTGYRGQTGIQSMLAIDPQGKKLVSGNVDYAHLLNHFYPRGARALLQDGMKKVAHGSVTFESLFKLTRTVPQAYLKHAVIESSLSSAADPSRAKDGEAPGAAGTSAARQALSGAQGAGGGGDQPLFHVSQDRAVRSKPLLLVVEDDPDQRNILQMVLQSADFDVVTAVDGAAALMAMKKNVPDLVVTDLMMPNIDGRELVAQLKASEAFKTIPILVLTVVSDADKEFTMLDLGADDYCEKTIQRKILVKRVENLLKRGRK